MCEHRRPFRRRRCSWVPAFAGMTPRWQCLPSDGNAVIVEDPAVIVAVPGGLLAGAVSGAAPQRLAVEVDDIAALVRIVIELAPGDGMMILADAEEAAEGHHGIVRTPRALVDHEILDPAELLALAVVDGCA